MPLPSRVRSPSSSLARRSSRLAAIVLLVAATALTTACETPPITWDDETRTANPAGAPAPDDAQPTARLSFAAASARASSPILRPTAAVDALDAARRAADSSGSALGAVRACDGSLRVVPGLLRERWAAWWGIRADSSALLVVARSTDAGGSWERARVVDTLDRGGVGCRRPAPAIAADTLNGYVHVAYFLYAREGPGVFYAHLMDPRAAFEPAVVIVYGERPSATDVASRGDTVVVAYEDPNSKRPQVRLAVSRTAGHLFEDRMLPVASSGSAAAESPSVAVGPGGRVGVRWTERPDRPAGAPEPVVSTVVRTGVLR